MSSNLLYLSLPLLGALIGYLTNYVAIRMLFRPLKAWRFFGVRLPMTPGVIPGARRRLARNIGTMVGEHLLTREDVRRALAEPNFQHDLRRLIQTRTEAIFQTELGPVITAVPSRFRSYFQVGIKIFRWRFFKLLQNHLDSEEFGTELRRVVDRHLGRLLECDLATLLPEQEREKLLLSLEVQLHRFLASPALQQGLRTYLDRRIDTFLSEGGSLGTLLPASLRRNLLTQLEKQAPIILAGLGRRLQKPEIREKIAVQLAAALRSFTNSLGPLTAMIGNLLSPEMVESKLRAWLAEKGGDVGQWLLDEEVTHQLAILLRREAEKLLDRPLAELLQKVESAHIDQGREELVRLVSELLAQPEYAAAISGLLRETLNDRLQQPLQQTLDELGGAENIARGRRWGGDEVVRLARSAKMKRLLKRLLSQLFEEKVLNRPLGKPADLVPGEFREATDQYLIEQVNQLLEREVPPLIDAINIKEIVTRKVDRLDLLRLEGLLLAIMQDQFKYINIFGALIGFMIGLLNLLILAAL